MPTGIISFLNKKNNSKNYTNNCFLLLKFTVKGLKYMKINFFKISLCHISHYKNRIVSNPLCILCG